MNVKNKEQDRLERNENNISVLPIQLYAVCTSRVIFGNERAFRDAINAISEFSETVTIFIRHEEWNSGPSNFFSKENFLSIKLPIVDYPLKGYLFKIILEAPFRYVFSNWRLYREIKKSKKNRNKMIIIIPDINIFLTWNFIFSFYRIPIVYRCGSLPARHNILQRAIFNISKKYINHYVVDSNYVHGCFLSMGIPTEKITIIRPVPPVRNINTEAK